MDFERFELKNGITLLFEKRDVPVVSLAIANKFGASSESSEIKGVAHLIEHLLFTGTKNRDHGQISGEIEKRGGVLNAFTSEDLTAYWFKLPSEHLFVGLDVLTDMLNNPLFEKEKFEKEKKVILEEIKMYHDNPKSSVFEKLQECMFESPFGMGIAGNSETVSSLKRDFVKDYFEKNYGSSNFVVCVVGNANINEVISFLEEKFPIKEISIEKPKIVKKNSNYTEERSEIDQAHFLMGFHAPERNTKEYFALEILNSYLADGMSSKLFLEIREKRGLAYAIKGSLSAEKNYSLYNIYVGTKKESIEEVKDIILTEISKISNIVEKDLEEIKNRLIGLRKISSEESFNVVYELIFEEICSGNSREYYNFENNIMSVSLEDIKSLVKNMFQEYSIAIISPK